MTSHDLTSQGTREDDDTPVEEEKARREAQELHDAGVKQWGTDGSKFNEFIALRSFPQLRATFDEYKKVRSKVMGKATPTSEESGNSLRTRLDTAVARTVIWS